MKLYVVATPIGNLKDITLRALEVLRSVDDIVAEDTRVSRKLLQHYQISKPLHSLHEHSTKSSLENILRLIEEGRTVAYIVDAGTPGVSDPGSYLIKKVREMIPAAEIIPIPGPSALTAAVSIAGLSGSTFIFLGFPPHKKGRITFFKEAARLIQDGYPVVMYESPHRVKKTLRNLSDVGLSMFECIIIKEISKVYEKIITMSIEDLIKEFEKEKNIKGEFVLVINNISKS